MGHIQFIDPKQGSIGRLIRKKSLSMADMCGISGARDGQLRLLWRGRDKEGTPVDFYINEGSWWRRLLPELAIPDNLEARMLLTELSQEPCPHELRGTAVVVVGLVDMVER